MTCGRVTSATHRSGGRTPTREGLAHPEAGSSRLRLPRSIPVPSWERRSEPRRRCEVARTAFLFVSLLLLVVVPSPELFKPSHSRLRSRLKSTPRCQPACPRDDSRSRSPVSGVTFYGGAPVVHPPGALRFGVGVRTREAGTSDQREGPRSPLGRGGLAVGDSARGECGRVGRKVNRPMVCSALILISRVTGSI
jgi:hypothetical protein